jgi:DNA topoisomerase-2
LAEMESQRAKLTNQARFVKAIIEGDLVVSKKKKAVLVAELDKAQYMRFPKIADAKKQGEFEAVVEQEEDESDDAETNAGANDFDYLLGMAIWSLTQERVDRLNGQIADKEAELDVLLRKSPKDLWTADLDDLLEEWQTQLDEAEARAKKVKNKGRRTSAKLGIGAKAGKKRKADSDDDSDAEFITKKAKAAPKAAPKKKGAASSALASMKVEELADADDDVPMVNGVEQKPVVRPAAAQQMTLDSAFDRLKSVSSTSTPEAESRPTTAGAAKKAATKVPIKAAAAAKAPAAKAPAKAAPKKKVVEPVDLSDEDEDEDDFLAIAEEAPAKPAAARGGRAAAQKAKSYKVPDDSDEDMSDGNDRLDDVSAMVKGIGAGAGEGATRFFHPPSAARPTSSGLKAKKRVVDDEDISDDETDWAALAQNSPMKATDRTLLSEEGSDDMEPPTPKPAVSKLASKLKATTAAPKTNGALKPKKAPAPAPAPAPAAPKTLSPAAKAYAAKQAKVGAATAKTKAPASRLKKVISDDEDDVDESVDAIANDILSDDDEDEDLDSPAPAPAKKSAPAAAAAARPSRRAAAAKPKARYAVSDEEDEEDDFEVEQESEEEESFDGEESD